MSKYVDWKKEQIRSGIYSAIMFSMRELRLE
jgi:hypothetical protein